MSSSIKPIAATIAILGQVTGCVADASPVEAPEIEAKEAVPAAGAANACEDNANALPTERDALRPSDETKLLRVTGHCVVPIPRTLTGSIGMSGPKNVE